MSDKRALVVVDLETPVDALTACCSEWASKTGSSIIVVGVAPTLDVPQASHKLKSMVSDGQTLLLEELRQSVKSICAQIETPNEHHLISGLTTEEVIKAAVLHDADFIIAMGSAGGGKLGKLAKSLIRKSPAPVWIVSNHTNHPPTTVAVAIDNVEAASNSADASLVALNLIRHAIDLAERFGLEDIHVVHAWSVSGMAFLEGPRARVPEEDMRHYLAHCELSASQWFNRFLASAREHFSQHSVRLSEKMVMGPAPKAIAQATEELEADVLVMGSANRTGIMGLLVGNTAEAVLDAVPCSMFVVKPEGLSAIIGEALNRPKQTAA